MAVSVVPMLANDLGVDWEHYSKTVKAIVETTPLPTDPTVHGKKLGEDFTTRDYREYQRYSKLPEHASHRQRRVTAKQKARSVLRDR